MHLVERYGVGNLVLRGECKKALRGLFDLSGGDERILVGMVGRICEEKGYDLLREILDDLIMELGVQMVILGSGEVGMEEFLKGKAVEYGGELGVRIGFDEKLSRWIYGGGGFFFNAIIGRAMWAFAVICDEVWSDSNCEGDWGFR